MQINRHARLTNNNRYTIIILICNNKLHFLLCGLCFMDRWRHYCIVHINISHFSGGFS